MQQTKSTRSSIGLQLKWNKQEQTKTKQQKQPVHKKNDNVSHLNKINYDLTSNMQ